MTAGEIQRITEGKVGTYQPPLPFGQGQKRKEEPSDEFKKIFKARLEELKNAKHKESNHPLVRSVSNWKYHLVGTLVRT